jgi:hypothetical protein
MKTLSSLFAISVLFVNCNDSVLAQSDENRSIPSFTKIENSGPLDVVLEKGSKESVNVNITGVDPRKVITEVDGTTLKVHMEKGSYFNLKGKITITYVNLTAISDMGSGDITCTSDIEATAFSLSSRGSGDIRIEGKVKATEFNFQHKGSGDVILSNLETTDLTLAMMGSGDFKAISGTAQKQTIDLMGSGDVEIAGLTGESCTVSIKGSGDVETNVSNSLQGNIMGSGNISYKGDPKIRQVELKGSGNVSKL